jgi:putative transposase
MALERQYGSGDFMDLCTSNGVRQSMGRVADCFDNALAESFIATFKCELIYTRSWPTKAGTRSAIAHWIEATYNRRRRNSSIGMLAPVTFEGRYFIETDVA